MDRVVCQPHRRSGGALEIPADDKAFSDPRTAETEAILAVRPGRRDGFGHFGLVGDGSRRGKRKLGAGASPKYAWIAVATSVSTSMPRAAASARSPASTSGANWILMTIPIKA